MKTQHISPQQARKLVSAFGWKMIQQGGVWYTRDLRFTISGCGSFYKKTPCNPMW